MVNVRLLSVVLGLLFVMHGVRDFPSALAQVPTTNGLAASDRKELVEDHGAMVGISTRKLGLQGRKIAPHMLRKEYEKEPKGMDKLETWKISGKSITKASKKSLERFYHHQDDDQKNVNMLDRNTLKPASYRIPRSKPAVFALSNSKQMKTQDSKTVKTTASLEISSLSEHFVAQEPFDSGRKDEIRRLLTVTKEIENLMQRDYKGVSKPRNKPPINNHEPRH